MKTMTEAYLMTKLLSDVLLIFLPIEKVEEDDARYLIRQIVSLGNSENHC